MWEHCATQSMRLLRLTLLHAGLVSTAIRHTKSVCVLVYCCFLPRHYRPRFCRIDEYQRRYQLTCRGHHCLQRKRRLHSGIWSGEKVQHHGACQAACEAKCPSAVTPIVVHPGWLGFPSFGLQHWLPNMLYRAPLRLKLAGRGDGSHA